ncbi:MAG: hypothetical protein JWM76_1347 [Pseudonocardiales bacterium]|nr:hypothetical protein [Pseudonocardiales bacterium]
MTGRHPASVLDLYGPHPDLRDDISGGVAERTLLAAGLLLGGLPAQWIRGHGPAMSLWVIAFLLCCAAGIVNARNRGEPIRAGRKLTYAAVALWMLAPFAGPVLMWLLRLPALEIVVLSTLRRKRATRLRSVPGGVWSSS